MSSHAIARAKRQSDLRAVLREPMMVVSIIAIFALLMLFIVYPVFAVFRLSLSQGGAFSTTVYRELFARPRYVRSITNSVLLGAVVATLGTIVGFVFAFAVHRGGIRARGFFQSMAILPIISPPFMFALSVILLFGRNGLISARLLGLDTNAIYGLPGLILVQTINLFPIAYLTLSGILQGIDPDVESCAMNLGAGRWTVFRTVTLPLAKPGILAAWLVVFVSSMTDFGNPIMIGGSFDVLSVQAYLEFTGMGNLPRGAALAVLLLVPTVAVYFLQKRVMGRGSYATITGKSSKRGRPNTSPGLRAFLLVFCSGITAIVLLFYGTIIFGAFVRLWGVNWQLTFHHFNYSWDVGLTTLINTVILAAIATPLTALLGTVIAFFMVRKRFPGRNMMGLLAMLSYAIPGTAIGIGYVLAFNTAPFRWSGTAFILVMSYLFRHVPIAVESGVAALKQISAEIEESATNLGADSARTFRDITLPLIKPAFFAGATFSFVRSMTAISAIIFLVSARWNHVTVLILAQTEIMRLGVASVMSFILILIIMAVIALMMKLTGLKRDQIFSSGQ